MDSPGAVAGDESPAGYHERFGDSARGDCPQMLKLPGGRLLCYGQPRQTDHRWAGHGALEQYPAGNRTVVRPRPARTDGKTVQSFLEPQLQLESQQKAQRQQLAIQSFLNAQARLETNNLLLPQR